MNNKHLGWIIPLCLMMGYLLGLYYNIPQTITIDYGNNMIKALDMVDDINISAQHCPDCLCNCEEKAIDHFYDRYHEQVEVNCDTDRHLDFIERSIIRLENNTKCIIKENEGVGWFLERR